MAERVDVCIVGAGPAGLSAALILGRCRRRVVVFDSGRPRNAASRGLHGFLTRDGTPPEKLRALAREELARYPSVRLFDRAVTAVARDGDAFRVRLDDGSEVAARAVLLATGREDVVPAVRGFRELYGRGVYHCPICDGWEHRDQPLAAYGRGDDACDLALELLVWSRDVMLCVHDEYGVTSEQRALLAANDIAAITTPVRELRAGADGTLAEIAFSDGTARPCRALFFVTDTPQKSTLPAALGCRFGESGGVVCDDHAATGVPGLFVAGNVRCGLHLAVTAAAEGAEAAVAINDLLCDATRGPASGSRREHGG